MTQPKMISDEEAMRRVLKILGPVKVLELEILYEEGVTPPAQINHEARTLLMQTVLPEKLVQRLNALIQKTQGK